MLEASLQCEFTTWPCPIAEHKTVKQNMQVSISWPLLCVLKEGAKKKDCSFISLCGTKKRTKERPPRQIVSAWGGFPRRAPDSGIAMNSHIRVLRQHDDPAPLSCTRLGYYLNGVKSQNLNPRFLTRFAPGEE